MADIRRRKREEAVGIRERGAELFKKGDVTGALQTFDEAIDKAPDEFRAHLNRCAALMKLDMPRRAVLSADRALHLTHGKEAKAWYRRASAWIACGEFNEAIADCDAAKRLEPGDKAIPALRKKAEEERENATWGYAADERKVQKLAAQLDDPALSAADKLMLEASFRASAGSGDWTEGSSHLDAARAMMAIEEFSGESIELADGVLTLRWPCSKKLPEGKEEVCTLAMLIRRLPWLQP
jgi:tetratricopeptide (TPR) repeat protein